MSDIAIKLANVSRCYKLYNSPNDRLKEALNPFGKKYHKEFYALKGVNLEVKKGEVLGIIGKNGSGKSTLLKIIAGVLPSTNGNVNVNGQVSALLELGAGFNPEFTGIQNIHFYGTILGFSKEEMEEKMDDIFDFADIGQFINQPLKTYSSGMKARLAFAVSVSAEPDIFIVDEVMAVGDAPFRAKCFARMRQMMANGVTVLFVSHAVDSVRNMCNEAIYLQKGHIVEAGTTKYVCDLYESDCRKALGMLDYKGNDVRQHAINESELTVKMDYSVRNSLFNECANLQRDGNDAARLVDFYLSDARGNVINQFHYDEVAFVNAYLRFNSDKKCIIHSGIDIKTLQGIRVANYTDPLFDRAMSFQKDQHVRLHFPIRFPLAADKYYITIGIWAFPENAKFVENQVAFSNGELLDLVEYAYYFSVLVFKRHPVRGPVTIHVAQQLET